MKRSIRPLLQAFLLLALFAPGAQVRAQPAIADQACDQQFLDAVESKGWMEAQRQTAQNQNLIWKPDSVLEYTCFQQFLEVIAVREAPRFSESRAWGGASGISDTTTDVALDHVVGVTLVSYLQANFPHTYKGGRLPVSNDPPLTRGPGAYVCDAMSYIWKMTKCGDFLEKSRNANADLDLDGFYEFSWYAQRDPRRLPEQFASCAAASTNFNLTMQSSYNNTSSASGDGTQRYRDYIPATENPNDQNPYRNDPMITHLEFILPDASCGSDSTPPGGPIPTGITIQHNEDDAIGTYEEHICTNPGCSFNGTKCVR